MNILTSTDSRSILTTQKACVAPVELDRFASLSRIVGHLFALLILVATPAMATQEYILPTLFDVSGVASNDVLNIRAAPNGSAEIIGTFPPNARNIEVVGTDATGRWARVNTEDRSGWASLRFLAYQVDVWTPGTLPKSLHCLGNEPFWSFRTRADAVIFATPDDAETVLRLNEIMDTDRFRDPRRSVTAQGTSLRMTAVIIPMACSDGMSDRAYGLDVTVILQDGGTSQMLTGCCSIAAR